MRFSLYLYRFFAIILFLAFIGLATIPRANGKVCAGFTSYSTDHPHGRVHDSQSPIDSISFAAGNPGYHEYLTPRYAGLISAHHGMDTLHKSTDTNLDLLNSNTLTTLRSRGENNFITRNLFSLIIKENQPAKTQIGINSSLYFAPYAGQKIGKIRFLQLDVFGPTLLDTLRKAQGWLEKSGNAIHMKTTEKRLREQLLFKSGDVVNPQLMADNEKIIRDFPYIQDVAIILSCSEKEDDEVDVLVIIKDRFEFGANAMLNTDNSEIEVTDQNLFGIGHQLSAGMVWSQSEKPNWGGKFRYEISDIGGKFIKAGIGYTNTYRETGWNVYLERPFIASKEDQAGGISLERVFSDNYLTPYAYTRSDTSSSYFNSDIWYGRQLKNRNVYSPLGNMIVAGRYLHQNFFGKDDKYDKNSLFRDHDFIMGSFAISKRYLFKNNQVYGFGITEDIPYGRFAELAIGLDKDNKRARPYFHFLYSKANILNKGAYFKWQVAAGGFLNNSQFEQGAISLKANYFTDYVYLNRHPYRFFINMELLSGINRFAEEYLVINRRFGIRDFFSLDTRGTNRLKLNIESVRFWGWSYSGFRFANYFFADAAFLSNDLKRIFDSGFYGGVGFGIRVHNESLVFNVLELRFSWIPIAPMNNYPYIFNAFGQPKARFDDFLGGKPQEILYQ